MRSSASPLILAFGSRTFGAAGAADAVDEGMRLALAAVGGGPVIVVHGACSRLFGGVEVSADMLVDAWCRKAATDVVEVRQRPADWERHKLAAGPIRNSAVLKEQRPDLAVAFVRLGEPMAGTKDMLRKVEKLRIPYLVITR